MGLREVSAYAPPFLRNGATVSLPSLSTDQVAAFVELARQGTLRKAAESLFITEQGLRNRLLALEERLGIELYRKSRGIRRVTSGAGSESFPVWSPDGSRLYYSSNTGGVTRTVTKAVEGSDTETDVSSIAFFPMSISPDGRTLAARAITRTSYDVVTVDIASGKITAVAALPANETEPSFSPPSAVLLPPPR